MINNIFISLFILLVSLLLVGCNDSNEMLSDHIIQGKDSIIKQEAQIVIKTPDFNSDSAYFFIEKQVSFGPRVPNTATHNKCAEWIINNIKKYDFDVTVQNGTVIAFNGAKLNISNIICRHNQEASDRILLCAHWDTRPFADRDSIKVNFPIDGANDGASGVGVLMEIARNIQLLDPNYGVDIIFFDAEDYGPPNIGQFFDISSMNNSWCLGSQYWCNNPTFKNYKPRYGILLDMVGAEDAIFPKEGISRQYASQHLNKIWNEAEKLGFGKYFVKRLAPPITDDHTYINQLARIPTIDIIHYTTRHTNGTYDFGKFHHTHKDNMDVIHKPTLKAVGQTVLHVIYQKI